MKILGSLYSYFGNKTLKNVSDGPELFKSVDEIFKKYPLADWQDITYVALLENFEGQKNVIRIRKTDEFITENPSNSETHLYWEQNLRYYSDTSKPFWQSGAGAEKINAYYAAFAELNADCIAAIAGTNYHKNKELLKQIKNTCTKGQEQ